MRILTRRSSSMFVCNIACGHGTSLSRLEINRLHRMQDRRRHVRPQRKKMLLIDSVCIAIERMRVYIISLHAKCYEQSKRTFSVTHRTYHLHSAFICKATYKT